MMGMGGSGKKGKKGGGGGGGGGSRQPLQLFGGSQGGGSGGLRAQPLALPHAGEVGGAAFRLEAVAATALVGVCKVKIRWVLGCHSTVESSQGQVQVGGLRVKWPGWLARLAGPAAHAEQTLPELLTHATPPPEPTPISACPTPLHCLHQTPSRVDGEGVLGGAGDALAAAVNALVRVEETAAAEGGDPPVLDPVADLKLNSIGEWRKQIAKEPLRSIR